MARIESVAKAGYYPTPPRVTTLIASAMNAHPKRRSNRRGCRILDPCCGDGEAAATVTHKVKNLGLLPTTYGVELNKERAQAARSTLDEVLNCDFFHTTIAHDSFDLLWLNPPYDLESPEGTARRTETAYLKRCIPYLKKESGILVFIIPKNALADSASTISREFRNIHCLDFPRPERDNFGQIAVTGVRKPQPLPNPELTLQLRNISWGETSIRNIADPPSTWHLTFPRESHEPGDILFASQRIDVELALAEAASKGILSAPSVRERFWPTRQLTTRPILPLRQGHIALMTAAGFLDNQVLTGAEDQDDLIIKGRTYKESIETARSLNSKTETEVMRTTIRSLNLRTGERCDIKL